uniref:Cadherin domain-containing protein n=1 Tax=Fundulus heteroclitus TaxID=8078 RepID=A0A3Q2QKZ6_FUNHE
MFHVDQLGGVLTVENPLDYESKKEFSLLIEARDSGSPPFSSFVKIQINITDVNDNFPQFTQAEYRCEVYENSPPSGVCDVLAIDADSPNYSAVWYNITEGNIDESFTLDPENGLVSTIVSLDRESIPFFNLTVEAAEPDNPLHTDQATVIIFVLDRNDNAPRFSEVYLAEVSENAPIFILQVFATDRDIGKNSDVTVRIEQFNHHPPMFLPSPAFVVIPYDLVLGTEVFRLTATDIDTNSSDHIDENESLTLLVVAKDLGYPSLTSQTEITFEVIGKNQFSPRFSETDVMFSVPEDLPFGSVAGKIQAEDGDYGPNGAITYCISPQDKYFPISVGEFSGLLTLTRELDYEKESSYNLQIKAKDGGWISKSAWLNVTVIVIDVNDNPPVFSMSEYIATLRENSKVRTNVLDVKATDIDSGINAQISFSIIAGSLDKFAIDPINGSIITLDVFDYEHEKTFDLTIKASNTARHTLYSLAFVIIHILDVNEFTPTFIKERFNFSVFKNAPVGTSIGKVTATDNDSGPEGEVVYLLFGHGKNLVFDISSRSGEIHTSGSLRDRGNSNIILKVLAKNSGIINGTNVAETLVNVTVIETNDAPMFTSTSYEVNVKEDSPIGTSVLTVSALDRDSVLERNRFIFRIVDGNTNSSFSIDPLRGIVLVNSPLDRERWSVYNLTVTATDNGSPPATGTTNVIVSIDDINDNAPKLLTTKVQVKENQPEETIVARLNALDFDLPPNQGPFTFWLSNLSAESAFFLTPDGVLLTTRVIDRENVSEYRLLVVVKDAGLPLPLSSTTTLHVRVEDENDNPPSPRNIFIEVKYFGTPFRLPQDANGRTIGSRKFLNDT